MSFISKLDSSKKFVKSALISCPFNGQIMRQISNDFLNYKIDNFNFITKTMDNPFKIKQKNTM